MLRSALSAVVLALCCSTAGAAGWSYKTAAGGLLPKGEISFTASTTSADGFSAEFRCDSLGRKVVFSAELEVFTDKPPRRGEPKIIDFKVSSTKASWSVDGSRPAGGKWKKSRGMVFADGTTAAQILAAALAGQRDLVISSGKSSASFSLSGGTKALTKLASSCR
jgi:hypothetical protein